MRTLSFCFFLMLAWSPVFACSIGDYDGCLREALAGDAKAQTGLAFMYIKGRGVDKSDTEAVKWYRRAAEQGNAFAQSELGFMYMEGRGVEKSDTEAVKWYKLSAEQGYSGGQMWLSVMYAKGRGVPQSDVLAKKWRDLSLEKEQSRLNLILSIFGLMISVFLFYPLTRLYGSKIYAVITLGLIGGGIAYWISSYAFVLAVCGGVGFAMFMGRRRSLKSQH